MSNTTPSSGPSRRPGRPRSGQDPEVRHRLVEAAASLFADRGYRGASVRQIARAADVTPAMVGYYLGDKLGLLEAVLDSVFEHLLEGIQDLAAHSPEDGSPIERFIELYLATLSAEPWIPHFLVREVLSENTPVRERFVERFARRAASVVPQFFEQRIAAGELRRDLDPSLVVLSLLGMCVFPLIAQPVIGPLLGYGLDPDFIRRLTSHTQRLFLAGVEERSA